MTSHAFLHKMWASGPAAWTWPERLLEIETFRLLPSYTESHSAILEDPHVIHNHLTFEKHSSKCQGCFVLFCFNWRYILFVHSQMDNDDVLCFTPVWPWVFFFPGLHNWETSLLGSYPMTIPNFLPYTFNPTPLTRPRSW